jgi:glucose/arabinose dehydrogenase
MPAYVEFHGSAFPSFSGGVTVGAHAGWSRLQSVELLGWKPASAHRPDESRARRGSTRSS